MLVAFSADAARALARELNVGIIGVETPHDATLVEPARVTGAGDFSTTIDAIRFQATTHHLTEGSFPVNHPKNYLGYVLAITAVPCIEDRCVSTRRKCCSPLLAESLGKAILEAFFEKSA